MAENQTNNRRTNPAAESCLLLEEKQETRALSARRVRVLALFEIFHNGRPAPIPDFMLAQQQFVGVEAVGIIATLNKPEGLHAQCGWFALDAIDWFWARITTIQEVGTCNDVRFRGGQRSIILRSDIADYILLAPHEDYQEFWQSTLSTLKVPACEMWPMDGVRPLWWPDRWASWWLKQPTTAVKRRASSDATELQALTQNLLMEPAKSTNSQEACQEEVIPTHLDHTEPWLLAPDSGFQPAIGMGEESSSRNRRGTTDQHNSKRPRR